MTTIIDRSIEFDAAAEKVWRVAVDEFHTVGNWTSQLTTSRANHDAAVPEGANVGGRVCEAPGFGEVHETMTSFSDDNMTFSYLATGLPGFVTQLRNTWTVTELGPGRSQITMRVELDTNTFPGTLIEPIMRRKLDSSIGIYQEEMKLWVEKGELSPAKIKLNAKVAKKAKKTGGVAAA